MFSGQSPVQQALIATLFTWFVTAAGSSMVFVFKAFKQSFLDASFGFAAGVMTAASFWSLLLPAIDITLMNYNGNKLLTCVPITIGFLIGSCFVFLTDRFMPENFIDKVIHKSKTNSDHVDVNYENETANHLQNDTNTDHVIRNRRIVTNDGLIKRNSATEIQLNINDYKDTYGTNYFNKNIQNKQNESINRRNDSFRKLILLIIAVTVHNIPEGLAVGVGFGAIGKTKSATFQSARNLAFGIGLQNFPEGMAVSLPLYASGFSCWRSFWYGQLSGMVEPIAGVLGAMSVNFSQSILPYALSFAAGAMLYVVVDNLIPEASMNGNKTLASIAFIIGFCLMMCLDVGLG